jgi:chromosome segregation ATPase
MFSFPGIPHVGDVDALAVAGIAVAGITVFLVVLATIFRRNSGAGRLLTQLEMLSEKLKEELTSAKDMMANAWPRFDNEEELQKKIELAENTLELVGLVRKIFKLHEDPAEKQKYQDYLMEIKSDLDQKTVCLRDEIEDANQKLDKLYEKAKKYMTELDNKYIEWIKKVEHEKEEEASARKQLDELKEKKGDLQNECTDLRSEIKALDKEIDSAKVELGKEKFSLELLTEEEGEVKKESEAIDHDIKEEGKKKETLTGEMQQKAISHSMEESKNKSMNRSVLTDVTREPSKKLSSM